MPRPTCPSLGGICSPAAAGRGKRGAALRAAYGGHALSILFLKLEYIFRAHLKGKDKRVTETVGGSSTVGSGAVGMAPDAPARGMTHNKRALLSTKGSYWGVCKISVLRLQMLFHLTPAPLGNSPLR